MLGKILAGLIGLCIGLVFVFGFFALLGSVSPGEVVALSIAAVCLVVLIAVHSIMVRRRLDAADPEVMAPVNKLRERRGF